MSGVLLVLLLGTAIGYLSQRFTFPNAVAQVLLGVLLGSAVFGWVEHSRILHLLGEIGVLVLLGVAGLELSINRLKFAGWAGAAVAALGIIFSIIAGYSLGWLYGSPSAEVLYISLALAATSIGISVQVLKQFGLIGHRIADVVIAAAVIDDVIALYLLGAAHGFLSDSLTALGVVGFVILPIAALGGVYVLCRVLTQWSLRRGMLDSLWVRAAWILSAIFSAAFLTHTLELSAVVGGFFAGVGVGEGLGPILRERSVRTLNPLMLVLLPFFFVMIGVQAQWSVMNDQGLLWFIAGLIALAVTAKIAGGIVGSLRGYSWPERWLISLGMVPRGEIALVIATLGFEQGHLTHHVFIALLSMTIVLSVLGPLLMVPLAKRFSSKVLVEGAQ